MGKMDKKWVILCSTAIAAVYGAGYYTTETQAAANTNNQPIQQIAKNVQAKNNALNQIKVSTGQPSGTSNTAQGSNQAGNAQAKTSNTAPGSNQAGNAQAKTSNTAVASSLKYKNGSFRGQGMNRRGYIQVQLTMNNDKITNVQISDWGMHYSESDVDGLPDEVLKRQSAQVGYVSGATYSSQAFMDAVQDALNQAHNG